MPVLGVDSWWCEMPVLVCMTAMRSGVVDCCILRRENTYIHTQGIEAVVKLKETMGKVISSLQSVRDPEAFAEKMYNYATSTDSKWRSLLERVEKGDKMASLDMQQFLLNKEIGDRKSRKG